MYTKYKRPRFTEADEDEDEQVQNVPADIGAATDTTETLIRSYPVLPPRKRKRFTEESDDDEDEINA